MIEVSLENEVLRLTLDRPDKANALSETMLCDLAAAVGASQPAAKVLVLTGRGRVFSAGADLDDVQNGLATSPAWEALSGAIARFNGLSIAALNGTLAGGAFGMVLACDLRVAVAGARFFYPAIRLGVLPQPSDPARLVRLVGPARAKMILLAGQKIGTEEALQWGLIDRVCAQESLLDMAMELAQAALDADARRLQEIKQMIDAAR